jgi:hypothetical protein
MRGAEAERAEHEHQMKKLILEAKPDRFGIGLAQSGGAFQTSPFNWAKETVLSPVITAVAEGSRPASSRTGSARLAADNMVIPSLPVAGRR